MDDCTSKCTMNCCTFSTFCVPSCKRVRSSNNSGWGGGVGGSQENQSILGKEVITPFVSPSCMDEHCSDPVQSCNQLPRTTSDRVDDAITHIILSAQNVHGLKSQWLYVIRPILNIQIACAPWCSDGKESAFNAGNLGLISGSGKISGEGNGNPLQYSCLENPMDRGAWWATVHGVAKSGIQLSD